jgi:hypothetical protein
MHTPQHNFVVSSAQDIVCCMLGGVVKVCYENKLLHFDYRDALWKPDLTRKATAKQGKRRAKEQKQMFYA